MRSEFEKAFKKEYPHADYLACLKFDEVENQYKPIDEEVEPPDVNFWICVGVNTGWWAWQHHQSEVGEQRQINVALNSETIRQREQVAHYLSKNAELQKRVDAVKQLIQSYKDEEKELELKEWEQSTIYGRVAIELEQALKGGGSNECKL